jgi:hypothetical protein
MAAKIMPEAAYLRECLIYAPETGILTWRTRPRSHFIASGPFKTWNLRRAGMPFGTVFYLKNIIYIRGGIDYQSFLAHRLIWKIVTGDEPSHEVDHRDGDGLNNRWNNLRAATHQQNQCNVRTRDGTLYPRGFYRIRQKYAASIHAAGNRYNLGVYTTPEAAHEASVAAAKRLHQQFSHTER